MMCTATVIVHICTINVAIVHKCTILHPLMWVFFCSKSVKWAIFFILQNFALTDAVALVTYAEARKFMP